MYEPPITEEQARAAGLQLSDYDDEEVEVWEECWPAVLFFSRLGTQWRSSGMGTPTGLDYTAVLALLRTLRLPRERADALFADVQVMEGAALKEMERQAWSKK